MNRMTDERLALLRAAWHGHNDALTELIDALLAERAEVARLRARCERQPDDPDVEHVKLLADPQWIGPERPLNAVIAATARVALRAWGEDA